eukprot:1459644-Rhodomonas_salina.2
MPSWPDNQTPTSHVLQQPALLFSSLLFLPLSLSPHFLVPVLLSIPCAPFPDSKTWPRAFAGATQSLRTAHVASRPPNTLSSLSTLSRSGPFLLHANRQTCRMCHHTRRRRHQTPHRAEPPHSLTAARSGVWAGASSLPRVRHPDHALRPQVGPGTVCS